MKKYTSELSCKSRELRALIGQIYADRSVLAWDMGRELELQYRAASVAKFGT